MIISCHPAVNFAIYLDEGYVSFKNLKFFRTYQNIVAKTQKKHSLFMSKNKNSRYSLHNAAKSLNTLCVKLCCDVIEKK